MVARNSQLEDQTPWSVLARLSSWAVRFHRSNGGPCRAGNRWLCGRPGVWLCLWLASYCLVAGGQESGPVVQAARAESARAESAGDEAAGDEAASWSVGLGRARITPREPMWLAGYASRRSPSEDVLLDLWAKALLLEDFQHTRLLLVTLDLVGIEKGLSDEICQRLQARHGLERDQVVLATSHTHTGPVVGKNLRPMHFYQLPPREQQRIIDYSDWLVEQIEQAVEQAFANRQAARLAWGMGQAGFGTNRRNNPEPEAAARRSTGDLVGPVDHGVPVLAARDSRDELVAVVFGYACHATVLSSNRISGDYPGFAQRELEQRFPGCTALFWAGCGADINPLPRRTEALAEHYGRQLALAVEAVLLTHQPRPLYGPATRAYRTIDLPLAALPSEQRLREQTESSNVAEAMRAKLLLSEIESGQPLSPTYPYPVQSWRFADELEWVHLGGEVVVDYAIRLKTERAGDRTWVTGYANDVMAYIPSLRVLHEGGYEGGGSMVYYGLPTIWAESIEEDIVREVHRQLDQ